MIKIVSSAKSFSDAYWKEMTNVRKLKYVMFHLEKIVLSEKTGKGI
jgi:hypothetical protein